MAAGEPKFASDANYGGNAPVFTTKPEEGGSSALSLEPPHITVAFCDVCNAIELLEPEQQLRVLFAASAIFGLPAHRILYEK